MSTPHAAVTFPTSSGESLHATSVRSRALACSSARRCSSTAIARRSESSIDSRGRAEAALCSSHALPVPDCAVVIVYVLSAQSAPHVDHEPTQLTSCAATSLAAMQSHVSWDYCGQRNAGASTATPLKGLTSEANRGGA
eukprot:COSAG03_NODE_157_length_11420_cov_28.022083_14_plen_139_part_00